MWSFYVNTQYNVVLSIILVFLVIGCGRTEAKNGVRRLNEDILDPPNFQRITSISYYLDVPEFTLPWNQCHYAYIDILYGTSITTAAAIDIWAQYLGSLGWERDLRAGGDRAAIYYRGKSERIDVTDIILDYTYETKAHLDMQKVRALYPNLIEVGMEYYVPDRDYCQ